MKYLLAILVTVAVLTLGIGKYDGPINSGVYISAFGHCAGYENKGIPGFWAEVDCE